MTNGENDERHDDEPIKDSKEIERKQKMLDEQAAKARRQKKLKIEGEPVKEQPDADAYKSESTPGPEDLCPCGSGKPFGQCHGKA